MTGKRSDPRIRSRKELHEFLGAQMNKAYEELVVARRLESESSLVKSYILETDLFRASNRQDHDAKLEFVRQRLNPYGGGIGGVLEVQETDEPGFFDVT